VGAEAALINLIAEEPDDSEGDAAVVRGELATCLEPLLKQLPNAYREAVILADFRGEAQRTVAERLGLSVPGAKSRVQRGRALLRHLLQACCELEIDHRGSVVDFQARSATCCQAGDAREPPAPVS